MIFQEFNNIDFNGKRNNNKNNHKTINLTKIIGKKITYSNSCSKLIFFIPKKILIRVKQAKKKIMLG